MLSGKQRRFLRAMGSTMEPLVLVGKSGVSESLILQLDEALETRELVKVKVLNNCAQDLTEIGQLLEVQTSSERVQTIGHTFLYYRRASEKPQIELP